MKRIKQILESKLNNQIKVDKLLQYDCELHTELGLNSTEEERKEVSQLSHLIIKEVVNLDPELEYLQTTRD